MVDALIIAAGYGSRLADCSTCKPLTPIAGIPLIELGIRQAAGVGVAKVVVVTGHDAERLEAFLACLAERSGIAIVTERLGDWSRPNGWSVIAGARRIGGDYLLLMADHLFERSILSRLMAQPESGRVTLAIDRRLDNPLVDAEDATWVRTRTDGGIIAIGKGLKAPDAIDCGAFRATPELAKAIEQAVAEGAAGSLSDGMERLARAGRASTVEIGDAWWLDVDDARALAMAEAQAPRHMPALYAGTLTDISS